MCGRYASTTTDKELRSAFAVEEVVDDALPPSYNVAPTQQVRVILERPPREAPDADPVRQLRSARWGLVPSWAKDVATGNRLINARSESITEKPAFRRAAVRRRCILPADGYFEWQKRDGKKIPYFLHGEGVLAMAGLYELWRDPDKAEDDPDRWLWSATILTTEATDAAGHIHDRSPVVLPETFVEHWLDPAIDDPAQVRALLASVPEPKLEPYEVRTAVNSPRNNSPELLRPV
ncbi:SOS response-associated peptidase [Rhodococcus triatomae]|uniref:Abasic site processing protein n=1 Tax=Rhodococcus triatomae TaxID=300028 RepID=A0A1G8JJY2_9NOCA|nr:SOS response-associated peptidase [Rhodococcus triatomae]QNG19709.1 SOS response-associated peptidase [Rhodococcus triatomae]QNG24375.1 SOS response-associated peptidase [Rhodococcus triatomae]SDI30940.1 Putative SOS response-associated peptidase YedK [Rhodococcus triatomae]